MKMFFRDVRSGKRRALLEDLNSVARAEIEKALDERVKPTLIRSHEIIVADWKHKPGFGAMKFIEPDRMRVYVFPTGEHKEIWIYVDQGTRPHTIPERVPKKAPVLAFMAGGTYVPKTMARVKALVGR